MTLSNKHKAIYAEYSYLWMESRDTIQFNLNRIQGASYFNQNSAMVPHTNTAVDLVPPSCLGSRAVGSYSSGPPAAETFQTQVNWRL